MFFDCLNNDSVVLEASEGIVDVRLDLLGTHTLSDLGEDTEHAFGILHLAVALLLHLLDDLLLFFDVHHASSRIERVYNSIAVNWIYPSYADT